MDKYKNVNVDKLANIYFEGNVISRNIFLKDGSRKTLGVMLPGNYEFSTETKELGGSSRIERNTYLEKQRVSI